jgi:hypothetical protein
VRGKVNLQLYGKEFFHSTVSSILPVTVSTFLPDMVSTIFEGR